MKSKTCWYVCVLRPHYCLIFQLLYSQWITRHSQQAHHHWHVSRSISSSWSRALVYLITRFAKFITILTVEQIRSSHWIIVVADIGQAFISLVQFTFLSGLSLTMWFWPLTSYVIVNTPFNSSQLIETIFLSLKSAEREHRFSEIRNTQNHYK